MSETGNSWQELPFSCSGEVNHGSLKAFVSAQTSAHLKSFRACFVSPLSSPAMRDVGNVGDVCLFRRVSVVFCVSCLKQHVSQAGRLWEDVCVRKNRVCALNEM